jgi:hypothetical protein
MNFLQPPPEALHPNANMDEEQLQVGGSFCDELVDLGVLDKPPPDQKVLLNAPFFVVPKEGQLGEWRVIADMLRDGQNTSIGSDPVVFPRMSHIVDQMYTGGSLAVVDASKLFYQFSTHPDDQPYLGLLHPMKQELYE